jgi:hypothetical protein
VYLRISRSLTQSARDRVERASKVLPALRGAPISVRFLPALKVSRGQLLSDVPHTGTPVHAAAFLRKRKIVLEVDLLERPLKLRLILIHEIFHFVWVRLGNPQRRDFAALLQRELESGARNELGESSATKKALLSLTDCEQNSRLWRDYVCESFCDTAAWYFAGISSSEFALARRWRKHRECWIRSQFARPRDC